MRTAVWPLLGVMLSAMTVTAGQRPAAANTDSLFSAYWSADSASKAARAGQQIVDAGVPFDSVLARLKDGRKYPAASAGSQPLPTSLAGIDLDNTLDVPAGYDPSKRWALRVQLHGGVGRMPADDGRPARGLTNNRIEGQPQLVLQPRAWATSEWWARNQYGNVLELVERVKRKYNVDESRVYITGISDGGTGVYFFAMRNATPWSACLPLNGQPAVLANPDIGADGSLFVGNLVNCPLYLVNGGKDRLYPATSVAPFVDTIKRAGASILFNVYPDAGHDTSWWPEERSKYEAFLAAHARVAHPPAISWETERTDRYNRFRWLVIDRLGPQMSDVKLEDVNDFAIPSGQKISLYSRRGQSGRVDVTRTGNRFEAKTRGVQQFTLLLSRDVVDFTKPVTVTVNGRAVFDGMVKADAATLLKWAAQDDDRTMLYAAELKIAVP
jgi:poly(3-hydroxybutyrate) depolymerase